MCGEHETGVYPFTAPPPCPRTSTSSTPGMSSPLQSLLEGKIVSRPARAYIVACKR
jgi:hypothetical protein